MDEGNTMLNEISQILKGQTLYESPYMRASHMALVVKNPPSSAGDKRDAGLIPGSERCPGEGHSNPLQCCCLENPMDRGDWQVTAHRVKEADTPEVTEHTTHRPSQKSQ